jgi:hypothetical protein
MTKNRLGSLIVSLFCTAVLGVSTSPAQPGGAPLPTDPALLGTTSPNNQARVSPHAITSQYIGPDRTLITIIYGRPYTIKPGTTLVRKIWGGQVPWDKADRLGSDESTLIVTPKDLEIAGTVVPAGVYTLYIIPSEAGVSKLAFSKNIGKWGIPVDEKNDVARFDLTKETLPAPVDQLTITVEKVPATNSGAIKIAWETTRFSLPFAVKK